MSTTTSNSTEEPGFILGDVAYKRLRFVAQMLLPALGTMWFTIGQLWHLPFVEETVGTILAIDTFLGFILGMSTKSFNASSDAYDGEIVTKPRPEGGLMYSLELNIDPETIAMKHDLRFKVHPIDN
jgi:hypothetical protein